MFFRSLDLTAAYLTESLLLTSTQFDDGGPTTLCSETIKSNIVTMKCQPLWWIHRMWKHMMAFYLGPIYLI